MRKKAERLNQMKIISSRAKDKTREKKGAKKDAKIAGN